MNMGLHMFINELLSEQKILPANVEIVQDNAKLKSSPQNKFQRKSWSGRLSHMSLIANSSSTTSSDDSNGNERRTRWQRMKKQHSDSTAVLMRPTRRSSLLCTNSSAEGGGPPPPPPPAASVYTPSSDSLRKTNKSRVKWSLNQYTSSTLNDNDEQDHEIPLSSSSGGRGPIRKPIKERRGRWQKTARRQSDSRLFVPTRRGSMEMPTAVTVPAQAPISDSSRENRKKPSALRWSSSRSSNLKGTIATNTTQNDQGPNLPPTRRGSLDNSRCNDEERKQSTASNNGNNNNSNINNIYSSKNRVRKAVEAAHRAIQ